MKRPGILGIVLLLLCIGTACTYNVIEPEEVIIPDEPVSFVTDLEPVFVSKCASCHASINPVLTEGNVYTSLIDGDYIDTANPEQSALVLKMEEDHPSAAGTLNDTEMALLLKWIEEGANDN